MEIYIGIDVGSTTSKAVIINEEEILTYSIIRNSYDLAESGKRAFDIALRNIELPGMKISYIVSTGYGRRAIKFQNKAEPEIICHAKGTIKLVPTCRTIIDIGGQDSKIMEIDEKGYVKKFHMNDKCAAGTGRYLDKLAKDVFQVEVEDLGRISLKSEDPLVISAQCTVFAESEIISYLSQGKPIEDIVAGLHNALARRVIDMGRSAFIKFERDIVFSGGVAKNIGMVKAMERLLGGSVVVPREPQITAALGAALIAKEKSKDRDK
ncbi:MAG: acyl-CoA dehydratase activase [Candidatus Bathyarchaeia archaeon]